jgi:opacity protein-like surface antigen
MRRFFLFSIVALPLIAFCSATTYAEEPNSEDVTAKSERAGGWDFHVAPYLWLSSISMDLDSPNVSSATDVDFTDLFQELDFAMQIHFEARRDRLALYLDESYIKVSPVAADSFLVQESIDLRQNILEFGVGYAVVDKHVGKSQNRRFRVEPFVGGRWTWIKPKVKVKIRPLGVNTASDASSDFLDLVTGIRFGGDISEKWGYSTNLNVGGFGIGSSSELSWNVTALLHYQVNDRSSLIFGYRHLDIETEPNGNTSLDTTLSGPMIGAGIKF